MKIIPIMLGAALASLLVGCATTQVVMAPVGPNPVQIATAATSDGQLEVFSAMQAHREGSGYTINPLWYQHTDYTIYDMNGTRVRHVGNSVGRYEQTPAMVALPPGEYLVKARAQDYLQVNVPVVIKPGLTTRVHLDDQWRPPADTPPSELVTPPSGHPIGWRNPAVNEIGMN